LRTLWIAVLWAGSLTFVANLLRHHMGDLG
jgi:hypothetical protein